MSDIPEQSDVMAEAHSLIMALHEEQLEPERAQRLEELVRLHPEVREHYVLHMHQRCVLATAALAAETALEDVPAAGQTLDDTMVTSAIKFEQAVEQQEQVIAPLPRTYGQRPVPIAAPARSPWRWYLVAASVLLVIGVTAILLQRPPAKPQAVVNVPAVPATQAEAIVVPPPVYVARLTREVGAKWQNPTSMPSVGGRLEEKTKLALSAGFAELTFDTGTRVVLEAPVDFTIEKNAVTLASGKLGATVPPAGRGFVVSTKQSTITDLGTELGVAADADGTTEVAVYKGKVTAQSVKSPAKAPVELVEGKAASVTDSGVAIDPHGANPQRFVRQLQTTANRLDLVDLLAGGDGTTHIRGPAIDLSTGEHGDFATRSTYSADNTFHRVKVSVIDGCFLPNGQTTIDSANNQYDFGPTRGAAYDYIRAGGRFVWPAIKSDRPFSSVLDGIDYAADGRGFILLHANAGVTFDLAAIRRLYPRKAITAFRSVVGNTSNPAKRFTTVEPPRASVLIFVDGKIRFERRDFGLQDKPESINMSLEENDRFLTLVTTDNSNSVQFDWFIFADPTLPLSDR